MSEFIAESTIIVKADTRPFVAQLKKAALQAEKTKVTVQVVPVLTGFRAALIAGVTKSSKGVIVKIPVRPDFTGFRAALLAGAAKSARGITVPVAAGATVAPARAATRAATTGSAAVTGGVVDKRLAEAQRALTTATQAGIAARRGFVGFLSKEERLVARVARQDVALKAAQDAVNKSVLSGSAAHIAEAEALERKARAGLAAAKAAQTRAAGPTLRAAAVEKRAADEAIAAQKTLERLRLRAFEATLPVPGADPARQLALQQQAQIKIAKEAQRESLALRRAGATAAAIEADAIRAESAALAQNTAQQEANNVASKKRVRQSTDVKRAAQSQLLTFAGLRGAALSAESAFLFAAAGTIAFVKALQSAAQLESTLGVFRVTAGATADEMERVAATARELGADITLPGVNAQDAAEALTELTKAGLGVEDSIDGARGVLQLATAAAIDNAQATELAASALNAFGLAGSEATHVADVLANAANASQGSIVDIGIALQQSAAVARQAGLSLEQTVGALTLFARAGLRGSDAGTSFRTALIRLINPTVKAQNVIDELGLHLRTATGDINLNIFEEFARATQKFTAAQRDQALAIIFGQDAIRGAAILAREGATGLEQQVSQLNRTGTAAEVASARMVGLTGSIENLKNQLTTAGQALGAALIPPISKVTDLIATMVGNFDNLRTTISQPFKIVFDFDAKGIPGGGGDEQNFGQRLAGFLTGNFGDVVNLFTDDLKQMEDSFVESAAAFEDATGVDLVLFPTVKQAQQEIKNLIAQLNASPGSLTVFNEVVSRLIEIQKGMSKGTEETKKFSESLAPFIQQLQDLSSSSNIPINITLPKEVLSGTFGRQAGQTTAEEFKKGFLPTFEETVSGSAKTLEEAFGQAGATAARQVAGQIQKAVSSGAARTTQTSRAVVRAQIKGSTSAELEALKNEAANQRKIISDINQATDNSPLGQALAARDKAEKDLAETMGRIRSLEVQRASDAKQNAQDIKSARDKRDQAFLDALGVGRTPTSRGIARAQQTEDASDDIVALLAFQKRLQAERDAVASGVQDVKTKTAELQRLDGELFQNSLDLQAARKRRDEALQAAIQERGVALVSLGEVTGNVKLVIKGLDLQIASAKEVLAKAIQAKSGQEAARAALEQLKKTRRDTINEAREALLGEAFRLAEARGNKSQMLQILDLQIKQSQLEERQAKTLIDRLTKQANTAELIAKKKEILEEQIKKGTEGTTAFDLLQQFSDTFNQIGGNLINAQQPFAGPTGFTADIAQFLRRRQGFGGATAAFPGRGPLEDPVRGGARFKTQAEKQSSQTDALITALSKLTDAILSGSGNDTTGGKNNGRNVGNIAGLRGTGPAGRRWFVEAHQSRLAEES